MLKNVKEKKKRVNSAISIGYSENVSPSFGRNKGEGIEKSELLLSGSMNYTSYNYTPISMYLAWKYQTGKDGTTQQKLLNLSIA